MKSSYSIFALGLVLCSGSVLAENWPQFQGMNRTGTSGETGLIERLPEQGAKVVWDVELEEGFAGAAIADGEVYVMDRDPGEADILICFDLETGKEKWRYEDEVTGKLSFAGSRNTPTIEDDRIYMIGGFGHVTSLDRKSHEPVWRFDTMKEFNVEMPPKWGYAQSPLVVGETLVSCVLSEDTGLIGLDKSSGKVLWMTKALGHTMSQPAYYEIKGVPQVLIVSTIDSDSEVGILASFSPEDGRLLWESDIYYNKYPIAVPVLIGEDQLFITGGYDCGSIMLKLNGNGDKISVEEQYRLEGGSQIHPPHVIGEHMYILMNENSNYKTRTQREESGGLACLKVSDGSEVWRTGNEPYFGRGSMIMADGKLIIQDGHNGLLRMVEPSPEGYRELGSANAFGIENLDKDYKLWSPLALSDGRLVMRGQGQMTCVDLRE